jgi:hypothetical protein
MTKMILRRMPLYYPSVPEKVNENPPRNFSDSLVG